MELFFAVSIPRLFAEGLIVLVMQIFEYSPLFIVWALAERGMLRFYGFFELSKDLIRSEKSACVCSYMRSVSEK